MRSFLFLALLIAGIPGQAAESGSILDRLQPGIYGVVGQCQVDRGLPISGIKDPILSIDRTKGEATLGYKLVYRGPLPPPPVSALASFTKHRASKSVDKCSGAPPIPGPKCEKWEITSSSDEVSATTRTIVKSWGRMKSDDKEKIELLENGSVKYTVTSAGAGTYACVLKYVRPEIGVSQLR